MEDEEPEELGEDGKAMNVHQMLKVCERQSGRESEADAERERQR